MIWLNLAFKFATSRVGMYILGTIAALAALALVYSHIYHAGEDNAINKIEQREKGIVEKSDAARTTVSDCYATGGVWRRETGTCSYGLPGVPGQPAGR